MIDISGENVVLVGALLLFVAVMAGKVAYRFGAPALLLFLGVGMLFGLNFISFRSVEMTQFVGMIALCIILFTGGMDTSFQEIKPIIGPGVEHAELLFNVVFLSTIISLLVQGTTVSGMANLLRLAYEERESAFNVEMHEEMKSALTEVEVNENLLASGHTLKDITLPENTLVMMVCRDGEYFVPQGKTELKLGDKLLVISDRSEELASTYKDMGIDDVMKLG